LQKRVMEQAEWQILPIAVEIILGGKNEWLICMTN
jgi:hypothetical protein